MAQADGSVDHHYRVGRLALPKSEILMALIAVAEIEGRLIVAVPEEVWHRIVARRLLSPRALAKPSLCSVATCGLESRQLVGFEGLDIKVWFGLLHPVLGPDVDYVSEEEIGDPLVRRGRQLCSLMVQRAQAHFAFSTADEGLPDGVSLLLRVWKRRGFRS